MDSRNRILVVSLVVIGIILAALVACEAGFSGREADDIHQMAYESDWVDVGGGIEVKVRTVSQSTPTPPPTSTSTPEPTLTSTFTPEPTLTPTSTSTPTDTPLPTATDTPTSIPPTPTPMGNVYIIPDDETTVDGDDFEPGDVLLISSTRTQELKFVNLQGEPGNPITIMNTGGQVDLSGDHWVGLQFQYSEWWHLTGIGEPGIEYGFRLQDFTNSGIFARLGSRNFEIDHVEIARTMAGIRIQTYRDEVPEGWMLSGVSIHHTHVHDTDGEAYYIGHRVDKGRAPLEGLEVAYNRIERVGTDGIQIRQAYNCDVHDNTIHTTGVRLIEIEEERPLQGGAGLIIGKFCTGQWHDNMIINPNRGIQLQSGEDDIQIYNNLIVDAGQIHGELREDGGIRWFNQGGASIFNNTIINSYEYGIRASSSVIEGAVWNNIIAGPDRRTHIDVNEITAYNNIETYDIGEVGFVGPDDYHLAVGSEAIDAGGEPCPALDLDGGERTGQCDIGAFEYGY